MSKKTLQSYNYLLKRRIFFEFIFNIQLKLHTIISTNQYLSIT